jgi:hypothetical protein
MQAMTIRRLAETAGVNIDTIRYYERNNCPGHGEPRSCPIVAALNQGKSK